MATLIASLILLLRCNHPGWTLKPMTSVFLKEKKVEDAQGEGESDGRDGSDASVGQEYQGLPGATRN